MKIILASASERRAELLKRICSEFEIIVSHFDESKIPFHGNCGAYVMELAKGKALEVARRSYDDAVIIGCDTIVALEGKVLGKPKDPQEAVKMLQSLSGKIHQVYSGIAVVHKDSNNLNQAFVRTEVKFDDLSDAQIQRYVETKDPMDKAGAYGIQGAAGVFVQEIHGCYYNVVGLPLNKLYNMLREMGVIL